MIQLRSYEMAIELYRDCKAVSLQTGLKDQLVRATTSIALNLAEGYGKRTQKDRGRFFTMAFGSIREVQAIADLEPEAMKHLAPKIDRLAASIYKLKQ